MDYKIILAEQDARKLLNDNGWILIDPGCTTLHRDGTVTHAPPEYCYSKEDATVKRKVTEVLSEIAFFWALDLKRIKTD